MESRDLTSLEEKDKVRKRPGVIFGTADMDGAVNGIYEIVDNSIDEAREGYGNVINFTVEPGNIITVEDFGRGLPMHVNEETGVENWRLALCVLYASGKYDSSQYKTALGTNGLGLASMQFASEFMDVESIYDGKIYTMHFKQGDPVGGLHVEKNRTSKKHGTKIRFKPDPEVFLGIEDKPIPIEYFFEKFTRKAMIHPGLTFHFKHYADSQKERTIVFENGMVEFIDTVCKKPILSKTAYFSEKAYGTDRPEEEEYELKMQLAFNFEPEMGMIDVYHNGAYLSYQNKNITLNGLRRAALRIINDVAKDSGKLKKNDSFVISDIDGMFIAIGATDCPGNRTMFHHQVKDAISNPFIASAFEKFCTASFRSWANANAKEIDAVIELALINKKAREEADRVSREVASALKKSNGIGNRIENFCDCTSKDTDINELYLVEGLSAFGSCKKARKANTQAILALKGKPLNCQKALLKDAVSNDVILRVARALGCGFEVQGKKEMDLPKFDINKLKYGKIMICTDGDIDGNHIRCLVLTLLYRLMPTLLRQGRVYIVQSPLYEITFNGSRHSEFAYSDEEKDELVEKLNQEKVKFRVLRSKGLGENNADMMEQTTMNKDTRKLIKVEYQEDETKMAEAFEQLLGNDLAARKEIIAEYFSKISVDLD